MHLKCETSFVIPWPVLKGDFDGDDIDARKLENVKGIVDAYTHFEYRGRFGFERRREFDSSRNNIPYDCNKHQHPQGRTRTIRTDYERT